MRRVLTGLVAALAAGGVTNATDVDSHPKVRVQTSQGAFVVQLDAERAPCAASSRQQLTTIASDWDDLNAVVDYIRALRRVERVHLIGWSLGGPRAGGFTVQHPQKVQSLVLLAPAFNRTAAGSPPARRSSAHRRRRSRGGGAGSPLPGARRRGR